MILVFGYQLFSWIQKTGMFGLESHIQNILFIVSTACCIYFAYQFNHIYFKNSLLQSKARILANILDFNSQNICGLGNIKVIYIDQNYKKILVDKLNNEDNSVWGIIKFGVDNEPVNREFYYTQIEQPKLSLQECIK